MSSLSSEASPIKDIISHFSAYTDGFSAAAALQQKSGIGWVDIFSIAIGISAFVLALITYLRDRPRVHIDLTWDMEVNERGSSLKVGHTYLIIRVFNTGRAPIWLSHLHLKVGKKTLITSSTLKEQSLNPQSEPIRDYVDQEGLKKFAKD